MSIVLSDGLAFAGSRDVCKSKWKSDETSTRIEKPTDHHGSSRAMATITIVTGYTMKEGTGKSDDVKNNIRGRRRRSIPRSTILYLKFDCSRYEYVRVGTPTVYLLIDDK
ncbi:hypothetical protein WN48_08460 [Eufriesea mexicana]|nr:hypothetical protein WN48_08460 [Eufriesea mexicana]